MKPDLTRCGANPFLVRLQPRPVGRPEVNAWAERTGHFHAREQSEDSHACAIHAKDAADHLDSLPIKRRRQLNREWQASTPPTITPERWAQINSEWEYR